MAGGEGLLRAFSRFGNHLLAKSELDPVLREIAILRVGVLSDATYEMYQHDRISRGIGMSEELLAGIRAGADDPVFDELQAHVMRYTDDVVRNVRASDATFDPLPPGAVAAGAAGADGDDRLLHVRVALPRDVRRRHRGGPPRPRPGAVMSDVSPPCPTTASCGRRPSRRARRPGAVAWPGGGSSSSAPAR